MQVVHRQTSAHPVRRHHRAPSLCPAQHARLVLLRRHARNVSVLSARSGSALSARRARAAHRAPQHRIAQNVTALNRLLFRQPLSLTLA